MISSWLTEGTAHRSPVARTPVIHLLVKDSGVWEWAMWCSGSRGREDTPHGNRLCRECKELAKQAVEAGDLDLQDVARWAA